MPPTKELRSMSLFSEVRAVHRVPVWFMRQAGRYSQHYKNIKSRAGGDFMRMCKDPSLAAEITLGPIEEYGFDAAILFSDILFPLEQMGLGLTFGEGGSGPRIAHLLSSPADIQKIPPRVMSNQYYQFQKEALESVRYQQNIKGLPPFSLLGFIGGPFTLFTYATGDLTSAKVGLHDGRYHKFIELLLPGLLESMFVQAEGGIDAIAVFDTSAGELHIDEYQEFVYPVLEKLFNDFHQLHHIPLIYYLRYATHHHFPLFTNILKEEDILGVDWRFAIEKLLIDFGNHYQLQGNLDPSWLFLPWSNLERKLAAYWEKLNKTNQTPVDRRSRLICGLGHGVLKNTPEENVKKSVEFIKNNYRY
ncbi:MAG: hypothetical protein HQK53_01540 [Oligoflexia bacterium]|nr:hypothetical protein [Oligoflexia bacterium]